MSDDNDMLMTLAKIALHADPRARDRDKMRKALRYNPKDQNSFDLIRCVCKNNVEDRSQIICCDTCSCWLHCKCVSVPKELPKDSVYKCPFCEQSDVKELEKIVGNIYDFHKYVFFTKKSRYTKLIQSAENVYNVNSRISKSGKWMKALIKRDDVYANIISAGNSCMKDSDSEKLEKELKDERSVLDSIADRVLGITQELSSFDHKITDTIINQLMTYSKSKVEPSFEPSSVTEEAKKEE